MEGKIHIGVLVAAIVVGGLLNKMLIRSFWPVPATGLKPR